MAEDGAADLGAEPLLRPGIEASFLHEKIDEGHERSPSVVVGQAESVTRARCSRARFAPATKVLAR
ncbi:hypothetical protein GCM10023201_03530 [Actinomycetospora corticicola]